MRAWPSGTPSESAISRARAGCAEPAKILSCFPRPMRCDGRKLVGAEGFEPSNTGSKVPRLTAWPRPTGCPAASADRVRTIIAGDATFRRGAPEPCKTISLADTRRFGQAGHRFHDFDSHLHRAERATDSRVAKPLMTRISRSRQATDCTDVTGVDKPRIAPMSRGRQATDCTDVTG